MTGRRRRGRPADPAIDQAVREAVLQVLAERGWRGVTIDQIASRAGVARTTVYRRYGSLDGVLLMLMGDIYGQVPVPDTGSVETDLIAMMRDVAAVWRDPAHVNYLSALVAAQHQDAGLAEAYQAQFRHRRAATTVIVTRGIERGELEPGTDPDLLLDYLAGIVAQRILLRREALEPSFPEIAVVRLLQGFAVRRHRDPL